jgi:hypothetical protein
MKRIAHLALASLLSLGLAACSSEETPKTAPVPAGPAEAIEQSAQQLKDGDLLAVVQAALPPEHYERAKAEWKQNITSEPASAEDRAKFAETMQKLTAADAEATLYAELEPQLAEFEKEMAAQMPLMVGMGRGFAMQTLQQSEQLTAEQKQQAGQLIDAVATWLQGAKFFDRDLARQAIGHIVATARKLEVTTLEQIEAMEFEQAVQKAGVALQGVFDVLEVYGLKVEQSLASVDAEVLTQQDAAARVKVAYTVFEQPLSFETDMVQIGDRWYGKDAIAELERAQAAKAAGPVGEAADGDIDSVDGGDGEVVEDGSSDEAVDADADAAQEATE